MQCEIKMINSIDSLTRFANSHIHQNVEEEMPGLYLTFHSDGKTTNLNFNITSLGSIDEVVKKALSEIENNPKDSSWSGLASKENSYDGYRNLSPENPDLRAQKVKDFIDQGGSFNGAGFAPQTFQMFLFGIQMASVQVTLQRVLFSMEYLDLKHHQDHHI